ncbi:MAG: hypothetical protein GF344_03640, partial [Chitinivibrionales bacterium]|nr:hypothetical protein [Chitinivibrionales bacterium]MBD3356164.1 hypothetical protein [Chitinivibrionales bacterium]
MAVNLQTTIHTDPFHETGRAPCGFRGTRATLTHANCQPRSCYMTSPSNTATVTIDVMANRPTGAMRRIWRSIGFDEINWTYTPQGKRVFDSIAGLNDGPFYIRNHNAFTSGDGLGSPFRGSTNVYTEDASGNPVYDWTIIDRVYDVYVAHGCKPMIELDFMPAALSTKPGGDSWRRAPKDYDKWR